jgi:HEAT repeat protein
MTETKQPEPASPGELPEEKSRVLTLAVQLFVIPLAVVLFCVALGGLFMWLTAERKGMDDYLRALRGSSGPRRSQQAQFLLNFVQESKRWQGIFDVTAQMSADRDRFLERNPRAVAEIAAVFEEARGSDPKTRRYLALVLGLLGDAQAVPTLRGGLRDGDADTVKNCAWALGRLGDDEAAPEIIELTRHEDVNVRLTAVFVLGVLDHPQARATMTAALNDPDELVQWNAAFGLASRGDTAGRRVLEKLLDKPYVDQFTQATPENRQRYRIAAVELLARVDPIGARPALEKVGAEDADLQVRNAAMRQLKELKK